MLEGLWINSKYVRVGNVLRMGTPGAIFSALMWDPRVTNTSLLMVTHIEEDYRPT